MSLFIHIFTTIYTFACTCKYYLFEAMVRLFPLMPEGQGQMSANLGPLMDRT